MKLDVDNYRAFLPTNEFDWEVLVSVRGEPRLNGWHSIPVRVDSDSQQDPMGDFASLFLGSVLPVLGARAVDALNELLTDTGELLPLAFPKEQLWVFNCTRFADVLDEPSSTIRRFSSGRIMNIERHRWRASADGETFFRIPQVQPSPIYLSHRVAERIAAAGLRGLVLDQEKVGP